MIRQRVDRHGNISPLELESELPACNVAASEIGVIKEGPVKKWMAAKRQWDTKFATAKRRVQKKRAKEMAKGFQQFGDGEVPPPSALAGRRKLGEDLKEEKKKRSTGMSLWALWGSKHDEKTIELEYEADKEPATATATPADGANARPLHDLKTNQGNLMDGKKPEYSRSRSRRRTVTDQHQTEGNDINENTPASVIYSKLADQREGLGDTGDRGNLTPDFVAKDPMPSIVVRTPTIEGEENDLKRPKSGGIAFPFSLKKHGATASMTTLTSAIGVPPAEDVRTKGAKDSGVNQNVDDIAASAAMGSSDGKGKGNAKEIAAENTPASVKVNGGAVDGSNAAVSGARPILETFVTATEDLPTQNRA